ncbi:MAG TPA: DUF3618 domain-containing protein [Ktedonobacterales bacterium]
MGERADRVGPEGQETPGDEFAQGRGWNAGDEEDPTMRNEPGLAGLEDDISVVDRAHDGETLYEEADVVEVQPETRDDATDETDAIRSDIEGTRANMSSTIDAIQEKLSPQRLTEQAKDAVRDATVGRVQDMASNVTDTARETSATLMDTIRENPLPAALVGIGVGWLFLSARRRAAERDRWRPGYAGYAGYGSRYDGQDYGRYRARDYGAYGSSSGSERSANGYPYNRYGQYGGSQYGSPQPYQQENSKVGQMADAAKDKLSDAGDRAQDMTDTVKERASDMADQAQWQAQRARGWLERTWDENPLVVAGAALAAGTLVGLSIPSTDAEREMMGEASGNVLQKAADTAQDATQNVSEKAQQTMRQADEKTRSRSDRLANASATSDTESSGAGGV